MNQQAYNIGSYKFYTQEEYKAGLNDLKKIKTLMAKGDLTDTRIAAKLYQQLLTFPDMFETYIGEEFTGKLLQCANGNPAGLNSMITMLGENKSFSGKNKISSEQSETAARSRSSFPQTQAVTESRRASALAGTASENYARTPLTRAAEKNNQPTHIKAISEKTKPSFGRKLSKEQRGQPMWKSEDTISRLTETEDMSVKKKKKSRKREAAIFIAGMLTCFLLFNVGEDIIYNIKSSISIKKLEALAACRLEPVDAQVSEKHQEMDNKASGQGASVSGNRTKEVKEGLPLEQSELEVLYTYSLLYEMNPDIVGWISIDNTVINYPVMQTKDDEEYYLRRNFDKKEDANGLPFMDSRCDVAAPTTNTILYGHNLKNGAMFSSLLEYKQEEYYQKHQIIHFDTIYEQADYVIVAAFQSRVAYQDEITFRYYEFINAESPEEFDEFIAEIKKLSDYDTGVAVSYGEQLLTLSTCDRSIDDGRFVVVAKRIYSSIEE